MSAIVFSPTKPAGDGMTAAADGGALAADGGGVITVPVVSPDVGMSVGLALLVPHADVKTDREITPSWKIRFTNADFNIRFINSSKFK